MRQGTIIQVRGNHGSGKSTVIRKVIGYFCDPKRAKMDKRKPLKMQAVYRPRRKQPIMYSIGYDELAVIGHYEGDVGGGTDSIPNMTKIYNLVKRAAKTHRFVLFEGIISQHSVPRMLELHDRYKVRIVYLKVPIKKCIKSIKRRRKARGETKPFNTKNTLDEQRRVDNNTARLETAGVKVKRLNRKDSYGYIISLMEKNQCK